ncbi:MAG: hypothetical protein DMG95_00750 [Acidobacteria bacterium]|nr:MAG: hypothetical protein DMG95_00750 [Acidobacteriota bacterium]
MRIVASHGFLARKIQELWRNFLLAPARFAMNSLRSIPEYQQIPANELIAAQTDESAQVC